MPRPAPLHLLAPFALALALAACERPPAADAPATLPAPASPAPLPTPEPPAAHTPTEAAPIPPTPMLRAHYACADGQRVEWRYFPQQGVAVLVRAGRTHELHPPPGRADTFAQPGLEVRLGASSLQIRLDQHPPIDCQRLPATP
ncbi:lysozyme inhibitor [Serpentinimonas raichei]|nr:lysozyme inhibitor [Serpentinimonas raichei]